MPAFLKSLLCGASVCMWMIIMDHIVILLMETYVPYKVLRLCLPTYLIDNRIIYLWLPISKYRPY